MVLIRLRVCAYEKTSFHICVGVCVVCDCICAYAFVRCRFNRRLIMSNADANFKAEEEFKAFEEMSAMKE